MAVTFRLSIEQFRSLLIVVMADDVADHLSNAVLMACTRPRDGIISVPLTSVESRLLVDVVDRAATTNPMNAELAGLIQSQNDAASEGASSLVQPTD